MWPQTDASIRTAYVSDSCAVLGPGNRTVVWVQGCPFRCLGCVAPETLPFEGGETIPVETLANRIIANSKIEGITFSGGEPMMQASALARLIDLVRSERDISTMSYSGFTLAQLQRHSSPGIPNLLSKLDILVDGLYLPEEHCDLLWRGSANQKLHLLTSRHMNIATRTDEHGHRLQVEISSAGAVRWMGIPPKGFREAFEKAVLSQGISLKI